MSLSMEAADKASLKLLLKEVERQIQHLPPNKLPQSGPSSEAVCAEAQDDDSFYIETLTEFKSFIIACVANETYSSVTWKPTPRHPHITQGSFWGKFLNLAELPTDFIHPTRVLEKLDALRNISERSLPDEDVSSTDDMWADERIKEWITCGQPPYLYLQEPPQRFSRLQKFGIELVRHLEKHIPVIHMLGGRRMQGESLSPAWIAKQLVYQAVFYLPTTFQLSCLNEILLLIRRAKTNNNWLETLEAVCDNLGKAQLALIVEITDVSPAMIANFKNWPSEIEDLSSRLKDRCGLQLQTLFLWPRFRLDGPNPKTLSGLVAEVKDTSRLGYVSSRLPSLRQPRPIPLLVSRPFGMAQAIPVSNAASPPTSSADVSFGHEFKALFTPLQSQLPTTDTGSKSLKDAAATGDLQQHSTPLLQSATSASRNMSRGKAPKVLDAQQNVVKGVESPRDREHIKLAIVCALTLEADAVHALFDDYWEDLEPRDMRSSGDTNAYSFGIFCKFPIVLVHMPGMGKTSASIVATNCRNSFPNLKLALVVGICGGVPFTDKGKTEIVLGDVIISEGLVPYDYGRRYPDRFLRKDGASDVLGKPPTELRGLLNKLKGRFGRRKLQERTVSHLRTLRTELGSEVDYLGAGQDHLFQGDYMHRHRNHDVCKVCSDTAICDTARSSTCEELSCDQGKLVVRERLQAILRDGTEFVPVVQFGHIACGDQVMKSGEHRDSIAKEEGVIAFEMEGAGVWDIFPCLVIKAVCDYADSHKQKKWQNYAAGTAAACTKALMEEWYM